MYQNPAIQTANIIGASLGGLSTAIALRKVGINARLYDKATQLRPIGAGLTLYPNGLKSLEALSPGLAERVIAAGSPVQKIYLKNDAGATLFEKPVDMESKFGYPMLNIRWAKLQALLIELLPQEAIHVQHACYEIERRATQIVAKFDNGKTAVSDLLIGADGVHSRIRQHVLLGPAASHTGRLSWRFLFKGQHPAMTPHESTLIVSNDRQKSLLVAQLDDDNWFFSASLQGQNLQRSPNAAATKQRLLAEFGDWAAPVPEIMAQVEAQDIIERPLFDMMPLERWYHQRTAVLGDAAHAMTPSLGQGANSAFEDACSLAHALQNERSLPQALAAYQASRKERCHVIQARSAMMSRRSYGEKNQIFVQEVWDKANMEMAAFDNWLYGFEPAALSVPEAVATPELAAA
ncbi:MAG: FAD-dependent monooxygenase [Chloroflexota bacterium]